MNPRRLMCTYWGVRSENPLPLFALGEDEKGNDTYDRYTQSQVGYISAI